MVQSGLAMTIAAIAMLFATSYTVQAAHHEEATETPAAEDAMSGGDATMDDAGSAEDASTDEDADDGADESDESDEDAGDGEEGEEAPSE